jgi:hypothetical protein
MKRVILTLIIFIFIFGSFAGCITNENELNDLHLYSVNYIEKSYQINETGYTLAENSTIIIQDISTQNITKIYFILTWEDTHAWPPRNNTRVLVPYWPKPDTFSLSITEPNGTNATFAPSYYAEETAYYGNINITSIIYNVTENNTIFARSYNEATKKISNNNGAGSWEINITCIDAPGTGPGGFMGPGHDMGNDWELEIYIYYFEGNVTKIQ